MGLRKKTSELNYLEMTPVRLYSHETKDDGLINVLVPRFTDKILGKLVQPKLKKPYIKANLDEFGTQTWILLDGKNKVTDISNKLDDIFGEKIHPVNERLLIFLTNLYKAGFITFIELRKD